VLKLKASYENAFGDQCTSESVLDLSILNFNLSEIKSSGEQKPHKKLLY
jgi:integral membrane protein